MNGTFLLVLLAQTGGNAMAEGPTPLRASIVESHLHAREDDRGKTRPESCMLVADLENLTDAALTFRAGPLDVHDAAGALAGRCEYERALVWEAAGDRKRYTTFEPPLLPREKVRLKLFFRFVDGRKASVAAGASYRYRVTFDAGGRKTVLDGEPFRPEVFPRGGGI